jgi:hypothetical protein
MTHRKGEQAMTHFDTQQQNAAQNWQSNPQGWSAFNAPWMQAIAGYGLGGYGSGGYGLGQPAYGQQQYGQYGQPAFGASGYGAGGSAQPQGWGQQQPQWGQQWGGQQRQLSPQDVNEVVRQLVPALPQILAQAQQSHGAIGYAAFGQQAPRQLSQQDVNEVVRQLLPIVPQIAGMLQNQPQLQYAAMQGGQGFGQQGLGQFGQGFGQQGFGQQGLGQFGQGFGTPVGMPLFQSAYGAQQGRQLTQQDVADVTRQLISVIPQVIGNLQAFGQQQRMI